jgi:hypothetical protein
MEAIPPPLPCESTDEPNADCDFDAADGLRHGNVIGDDGGGT